METMPNWLHKRAYMTPERIAIVENQNEWTYRDLQRSSLRMANGLKKRGVRKGHHVGFLMGNGVETVLCLHALMYIGAVIVPLNFRLTSAELRYQISDAELSFLVTDTTYIGKATEAINETEVSLLTWDRIEPGEEQSEELQTTIALSQLHTIMYTSGTTGKPKGVMLTYGNHWWSAVSSSLNLGLDVNDRWLCAVPMYHMSGLSILLRSVIYGITTIVHSHFDPKAVNESIHKDGVTIVSVVSAMLKRMLDELGSAHYPETFRCMLLGGGPAPYPLLSTCQEKQIPVYQTFGMTETASQIVTLSPEYMLSKQGSAGKALFPSELRIMEDGKEVEAFQHGEIIVKGPTVTSGYYNRETEGDSFINGWFHTGDQGYLDDEGFLFVLDRRKDLIISGGENIYPAEIEAALLDHENILDAGVTSIREEEWGEVPVAYVVRKAEHVSEQELLTFLSERLARYKLPKRITFLEELPRNGANKLQRRLLGIKR